RQSVGLTYGGYAANFDRDIEVANHAPNDQKLLKVFLPEHGEIRSDDVEELQDDGSHAPKMSRPAFTFQCLRDAWHLDVGLECSRRVNRKSGRSKDRTCATLCTPRVVGFRCPGVASEILLGSELGGIDEDRNHDEVRVSARRLNQLYVAVVQGPHRRNKAHR